MSLGRLPKPIYSSKNFKIFAVPGKKSSLRISVPKNIFGKAVVRNKIKRQIKSVYFEESLAVEGTLILIMVYKPFLSLDYKELSLEMGKAVKL